MSIELNTENGRLNVVCCACGKRIDEMEYLLEVGEVLHTDAILCPACKTYHKISLDLGYKEHGVVK